MPSAAITSRSCYIRRSEHNQFAEEQHSVYGHDFLSPSWGAGGKLHESIISHSHS
jgi:hypothetical protein